MFAQSNFSFNGQKITFPAALFGIALLCFLVFGLAPVCIREFSEGRDRYDELQKKLVVMRMLLSRLELHRDYKASYSRDLGMLIVLNMEARALSNGCDRKTVLDVNQLMNETSNYVISVKQDWNEGNFHHLDHKDFNLLDSAYATISNGLAMRNQVTFELHRTRSQLLSLCCLVLAACFLTACIVYLWQKINSEKSLTSINHVLSNTLEALNAARARGKQLEEHKQELFAIISHEIRSPLGNVSNKLESLLAGVYGNLSESTTEVISRACINVDRLIVLLNDLLSLEKLNQTDTKLVLSPVPVADLLGDALSHVESLAEKSNVRICVEATEYWAFADENLIVRVLINLLTNAIKFSPASSTVDMKTRLDEGTIEISVSDQGPGIADGQLEEIFEKFKQMHNDSRGAGLGLYLCKRLMDQHDGTIKVMNNVDGVGCTFLISLKCAEPEVESQPANAELYTGSQSTK